MKVCKNCGAELPDEAMFCLYCHAEQSGGPASASSATGTSSTPKSTYRPSSQPTSSSSSSSSSGYANSTLKIIAFVLCVLSCIAVASFVIPLIWCIPATIAVYKSYKYDNPISTLGKVLILIFVNLIAGILLLIDKD